MEFVSQKDTSNYIFIYIVVKAMQECILVIIQKLQFYESYITIASHEDKYNVQIFAKESTLSA